MTDENEGTGLEQGATTAIGEAAKGAADLASSAWDAVTNIFDGGAGGSDASGGSASPEEIWDRGGMQPPTDWDAYNQEQIRKQQEAIKGGMDEWEATITYKTVDPQNPDAIN